jgi:hypothetical protein
MDQIILGLVETGWLTAHVDLVPTAIALAAALFALLQANAAKQQVKAAKEQVIVAKDQARAAMEQVEVARSQLQVVASSAEEAAKQAEAYAGAQSAIAWRDQVFALHDRGLSPGKIRYIMHLEDGGGGYEGWNGRIDDVVCNLPSAPLSAAGTAASAAHGVSCDQMPRERYGCTGPCQETARHSGCEAFRLADSGSPNESAGQVRYQD